MRGSRRFLPCGVPESMLSHYLIMDSRDINDQIQMECLKQLSIRALTRKLTTDTMNNQPGRKMKCMAKAPSSTTSLCLLPVFPFPEFQNTLSNGLLRFFAWFAQRDSLLSMLSGCIVTGSGRVASILIILCPNPVVFRWQSIKD